MTVQTLPPKHLEYIDKKRDQQYVIQNFSAEHIARVEKYFQNPDDSYYDQHIFPIARELYCKRVQQLLQGGTLRPYKHFIILVGFSPEPIALLISAFNPEKVHLIVTPDSENSLDRLENLVPLSISRVNKILIKTEGRSEIYNRIRDLVDDLETQDVLPFTAVDITGGKKSMSSELSMLAGYKNIDILYTDYEVYMPKLRKPYPGTEKVIRLENPLEIYGEFEIKLGISKFNDDDFQGAAFIFHQLNRKIRDNRITDIYSDVANAFNAYDQFDFDQSRHFLQKACDKIERQCIREDLLPSLRKHLNLLEPLRELQRRLNSQGIFPILSDSQTAWHLTAILFEAAQRHYQKKWYDMSSLLFYRTLELMIQRRLASLGIDASKPKYDHFLRQHAYPTESHLLESLNQHIKKRNLRDFSAFSELPKKISLMNGILILITLGDPSFDQLDLNELRTALDHRNQSKFAHGLKNLTEKDVNKFRNLVQSVMKQLWKTEPEQSWQHQNLEAFLQQFAFPKL